MRIANFWFAGRKAVCIKLDLCWDRLPRGGKAVVVSEGGNSVIGKRGLVEVTLCTCGFAPDGSDQGVILTTVKRANNWEVARLVMGGCTLRITALSVPVLVAALGHRPGDAKPWDTLPLVTHFGQSQPWQVFRLAPGQTCYTLEFGLGQHPGDPRSLYVYVYLDDAWHQALRRIQSILRMHPSATEAIHIDAFHTGAQKPKGVSTAQAA